MPFKVVWRSQPGAVEVRTDSFTHLDDARAEAQLFSLSIPGTVETKVFDEAGNQLDIAVRNNDA
jgi:hypothetical protein